jgi:hypothetical protein
MPAIRPLYRRLQAATLARHAVARQILGRFGFVEEGIECAAGRDGQDFVRLAIVNPDYVSPATVDARRAALACAIAGAGVLPRREAEQMET